ncbi:HAMP domain-containing sensor histidine kinase [Rheinheimera baltica]|uniref:sensor histidine kinase n=1 Tax=Rheinheimera baltica TaxID=67576 RepID=UPI00273F4358|nr:HAMP domain-containing sensor histidine kinase [Rheinheimera baltica]MDP5143848.1 HAMP domain-containing sensor histidine kinase [Rheinheimera baltica]
MYRHSLRQRVAIAFALCVAVLSVVWGFAFLAAIRLSEDRVLTQQLQVAAQSYPVMPANLRGYDTVAGLPESLRAWAQTNPAEGIYEFETEELHVAVIKTANEPQQAFVVFDVAGIEAASSEDWWLLLVISGVVGTLGVLGFGLGVLVMRRAVAPVAQLAKAVADIDTEQLSMDDYKRIESGRFGDDEVGVLAATIEKTLERISAFVARERYFTSSASHELRTPITVITGALELLEQSELSAADIKTLDRVRRATLDMQTTIEMFLCLARETDDGLYDEQFFVLPLVSKAIEQQRYLLSRKMVDVEIDHLANPRVCGHPQAFATAVNNLVRNAFEHTLTGQGPVTIRIAERELLVTNQLSSAADEQHSPTGASSHGYGLGLGIVQRLCERNGWSFSLLADETRVVARLSW